METIETIKKYYDLIEYNLCGSCQRECDETQMKRCHVAFWLIAEEECESLFLL